MSEAVAQRTDGAIRSLVPARMDRLPWTRFHWSVVVGLGVSWILDGLEIQIVSLVRPFQKTLGMSTAQVGLTGTVYLVGEVVGALFFGRLTDKLGRARSSSSSRWRSTWSAAASAALSWNIWFLWSAASSPAWVSAASTPRSTPPSTSSSRRTTAAASTSRSTAPTGSARVRFGALANLYLLNPDNVADRTGAGVSASSSARCSA